MLSLSIHRFTDCDDFNPNMSAWFRHRTTTTDTRRVTCEACKRRIVDAIVKRNWSQLSSVEKETLDVAAIEVEEFSNEEREQEIRTAHPRG